MTTSELKPCPFCGGEATLCKEYPADSDNVCSIAIVKCQSCGCNTGAYIEDIYYESKLNLSRYCSMGNVKNAINAWNRRVEDGEL